MSFADLKRNSTTNFDKLTKELSKQNTTYDNADNERLWKCATDKAGNGYAVIRFLPAPGTEDFPFVKIWDHGFQGPTGLWYIEKSLTTLGQPDPVGEHNSALWQSGVESDKDVARKQKRRLAYYSNIYIVKDAANPEREGKVFLYKYGKKIFEKLQDLMNPSFDDETPVNPFDLWKGANFKLKIRKFEGYPNYDKSEFAKPAPLFDDDDMLEATWKLEFSLTELVDPKHFKSYDVLKARRNVVLGQNIHTDRGIPTAPAPTFKESVAPAAAGDDDLDDFFAKLRDED